MKRSSMRFFDQQPLFILDHESLDILDVNEAAIQFYGYSRSEFLSMNISDLGERDKKQGLVRNLQRHDQTVRRIWKHQTKNGDEKYVQFTSHLFNYDGKPSRIAVAHDITSLVEANETNVLKYPQIPSKLSNSPLIEIEWNKDLTVKDWSDKAENLFGWKEEEVIGNEFFMRQFVHEDEQDMAREILNKAIRESKNNYTVEGRNYTKDGRVLYCCWYNSLLFDENGKLISIYSLVDDISERKQSENLFKALSEESLVGVYLIQDGVFKYVNPRFATIFGYEKSEVEFRLGPEHLTHPDDWKQVDANIKNRIDGRIPSLEDNFRCLTKGGQIIHVNIYGSRINYMGEPAVVGTLVDITDSKLAYERYRASVESFEDLFDSISDALYIQNREGKFIKVNQSAVKLNGYDRDFLIGNTPDVLAAPGKVDMEETWGYFHKALKGEPQQFQQWGIRKNGEVFPEEVVLNPGSYFGEDVVIAISRDISDRYETEEQMRKNEELFRQLFQNAPIGIVMMDERQEIRVVNNAFENIFGYSSEEIKGYDIDKLIVPDEQLDEASQLSASVFEGIPGDMTTKRKRKDGSLVDVLIYGVPVNMDGRTIAIFGIYVDITERKNAEERIRHSLKEKEVLLAEIHHRVKNNLAVITGLLELQTYNTESDDARQVLYQSQMRINSIALIHEKLYQSQDLSQISFDIYIKELTDIIFKSIANDKCIELSLNVAPVYLTVNQAIPCGLILNELITNAFKHAFQGKECGNIMVELLQHENTLKLTVCDDGVGLPEGLDLNKPKSLGLTLIRTLTSQLKGNCSFTNNGKGTIFQLNFEADR